MDVRDLLQQLIAFPSVVGRPNGAIVDFVRTMLVGQGAQCHVIGGPEGDRFNLFASFGPVDRSGYVLSAHLDVVPADEPGWQGDPFALRQAGDRLIGRGACDMKGFVAAVLSMAPDMAAAPLERPLHIALSYDEEAGCAGVPHLLRRLPSLCAAPQGCIVGEPTGLVPVLGHKGKAAMRLSVRGIGGHSSRPDLGRNAIHGLTVAMAQAVALSEELEQEVRDSRFDPPWSTLQIGVLRGGTAINVIPDAAEADVEVRAIPGTDPMKVFERLRDRVGPDVTFAPLSAYPAMALDVADPLVGLLSDLTGQAPQAAVSFGTEAGLYQAAGIPSVVCGPGDIARAHRPEEFITTAELEEARMMVRRLIATVSRG